MEEEKFPYSYHTFLYPFRWSESGSVDPCAFRVSDDWEEDVRIPADVSDKAVFDSNIAVQCSAYRSYRYFNVAARSALFLHGDGVVRNLKNKSFSSGSYTVSRSDRRVKLTVNDLRLKVFNTGIAILVFETEYYPEQQDHKNDPEAALDDILFINEFGRRLYTEFYSDEPGLWASNITLSPCKDNAAGSISQDFDPGKEMAHPDELPLLIRELLFGKAGGPPKSVRITPALDDRMFVCCCILDAQLAQSFIGERAEWDDYQRYPDRKQSGEWRFMADWKTGEKLYRLTQIDYDTASCQNRRMMDDAFRRSLYLRWVEMGTIHSVTGCSAVCLTSQSVNTKVVEPFLTLYVEMAILVLAQRASLISFDEQLNAKSVSDQKTLADDLLGIEEGFARFQAQLLIPEITSQIQGIEYYSMLQRAQFIPRLENSVQAQIGNLSRILRYRQENEEEEREKTMNYILFGLAFLSFASFAVDIFQFIAVENKGCLWYFSLVLTAVFFVFAVVFLIWRLSQDTDRLPIRFRRKGDQARERDLGRREHLNE